MASPNPPLDTMDKADKDKRRLSRVMSRVKSVLKKGDGASKRLSFSAKPATAAAATTATATAPASNDAAKSPTTPSAAALAAKAADPIQSLKLVMRSEIEAERALRLAERFKITLQPTDWQLAEDKETLRVEKSIRMRIHRTCHKCGTTFGSNKICAQCQHQSCSRCPRYPRKRDRTKGKAKVKAAPAGERLLEADDYRAIHMDFLLTKPSKVANGRPLVRKKAMQRVRRTCHECGTQFPAAIKACVKCLHVRCSDCPRDPPKKKKYPYGYPGDAPSANAKYFSCHHCTKVLPPLEESSSSPACPRCKHVKCDDCPVALPRKVEPEFDMELLKMVEGRLEAMKLGEGAPAA